MACDSLVADLLQQHNRPFNTQNVADLLAIHGVKKTAVQKSLDALADAGKIVSKDFGKVKIYFANQSNLALLSKEELDQKNIQLQQLQASLQEEAQAMKGFEEELQDLQAVLTAEQVETETDACRGELRKLETKLEHLSKGAILVTAEERATVEKALSDALQQWKRNRGIFKSIWNSMAENIEGKEADLMEDMGVDTDEAAGLTYQDLEALIPKKRKR